MENEWKINVEKMKIGCTQRDIKNSSEKRGDEKAIRKAGAFAIQAGLR